MDRTDSSRIRKRLMNEQSLTSPRSRSEVRVRQIGYQ